MFVLVEVEYDFGYGVLLKWLCCLVLLNVIDFVDVLCLFCDEVWMQQQLQQVMVMFVFEVVYCMGCVIVV